MSAICMICFWKIMFRFYFTTLSITVKYWNLLRWKSSKFFDNCPLKLLDFRMGLLILDHCVKDFLEFGLCLVAYIIFMMLLQRLFSSFKYSFSYGEGCLVLKSLIVFFVKSILWLLKFKRIHNVKIVMIYWEKKLS